MSTEVKFRRGTNAEHAGFTGAAGEMTVDTTNDRLVVHDGATAGGFPQTSAADLQDGAFDYAAGTGTDRITVTLSPAPDAYVTGMKVRWKQATSNTGACTINVNGLGAKNIKTSAVADPAAADVLGSAIIEATYDGTQFLLGHGAGGSAGGVWTVLETVTPAAVATADLTAFDNSTYDIYKVIGMHLRAGSRTRAPWLRTSTDGGSTFHTARSSYRWHTIQVNNGIINEDQSDSGARRAYLGMRELGYVGVVANAGLCFEVTIYDAPGASHPTRFDWRMIGQNYYESPFWISGGGYRSVAEDTDAVQFLWNSGNIETGTLWLLGGNLTV